MENVLAGTSISLEEVHLLAKLQTPVHQQPPDLLQHAAVSLMESQNLLQKGSCGVDLGQFLSFS